MKLSLKNLLIILGVLVIGFFAVRLTKSEGRSKSLRSELVSIDTADVSKVEILGTAGPVVLTRNGDDWNVQLAGGEKKTKQNVVKAMLATLNTIEPSRLASKKKDKWKDYQVDSTGTRIKVYAGNDLTTDIVLGRFGVEGQRNFYSFVRLFEDENVYVANGFMKMSIYENANDYRDNDVLRLNKDSLTQVAFNYPEGSFSLTKNADWYIEDVQVDSASVATFLQALGYASSKLFYDEETTPSFTHSVTFSFSNSPDIVIEGSLNGDTGIVRSSENSTELFADQTLWEKLFKDPGVFATTLQ